MSTSPSTSSTTVIVGDIHGRADKLEGLLTRIGVLADGARQPGFHVVQLGDLVNLGSGAPELAFLERCWPWFDEVLVGNHEAPALYWDELAVTFQGWHERDRAAARFINDRASELRVATSIGNWLITHAGLSRHHWNALGAPETAASAASCINEAWKTANDTRDSRELFEGIGQARGGTSEHPGILWADVYELLPDYAATDWDLRQIVGHTSDCGPKLHADGALWCIDTRGGAAALVTTDDGASLELVREG